MPISTTYTEPGKQYIGSYPSLSRFPAASSFPQGTTISTGDSYYKVSGAAWVAVTPTNTVVGTLAGASTFTDAAFTLTDDADPTKIVKFQLSGITTGVTRTYAVPNGDCTLLGSAVTNSVSGVCTFSNATNTFGSSTSAGTQGFASGATLSGNTKTINIGTGGVSGSTTTINIGSLTSAGSITFLQPLIQTPAASSTPTVNGQMVFEKTSNTSITVKLKGSDGIVRSGIITLA